MSDNELLHEILIKVTSLGTEVKKTNEKVTSLGTEVKKTNEKVTSLETEVKKTNERIDVLSFKQDMTHKKLDDLSLDVKIIERNIKKDIHNLNDVTETMIEVLRQNELIPS